MLDGTSWGEMLSINEKKLYAGVRWQDYVKSVQNVEKCTIDFFC